MYALLVSAVNVLLTFIFKGSVVKWGLFVGLYFLVVEFTSQLTTLLPASSSLTSAFSGIASGVWYFLDLFAFSQGLPMVLSAVATRFIIRRLPVIG